MEENVDVSILMVVYNQVEYIEKAINSIIFQNTKYKFELLIGDDCSLDGTTDIVKKYARRYPDKIKAILRRKNIGATKNSYNLLRKSRGRYIAFCDGDDEWVKGNRLDRQIEFLDSHLEYSAICGKCKVIDQYGNEQWNSEIKRIDFWSFEKKEYFLKDFQEWKMPGHISAIMGRNIYNYGDCNILWKAHNIVGDRTIMLLLSLIGPIYCDDNIESKYRLKIQGNNFVAQYEEKNLRYEDICLIEYLEQFVSKKWDVDINLSAIKEQRFVGAIVAMLKESTNYNKKVVWNILIHSNNVLRYIYIFFKVFILKIIYWNIFHIDKNIVL